MKRLLPFLLLAAVSLAASAQVRVDSLNRLVLGNASLTTISQTGTQSTPAIGGGSTPGEITPGPLVFEVQIDSLSRMCVFGEGYQRSGGKLRVEAHDVQFGSGFIVEPGGTIDIQIKK